ncbi:MAG TPA: hypothetical protein VFB02_16525 [Bradyrhizobium sp.]|nr:hypothetical protein [Bradyrhizobium sp.]
MIEPISSLSVDVVPQAIIALPIEDIVGERVSTGYDDFDSFEGASFKLDREIEIAVRHYRGHPKNTTTIYIDRREADVQTVTRLIRKILHELNVPLAALQWERQNDPTL